MTGAENARIAALVHDSVKERSPALQALDNLPTVDTLDELLAVYRKWLYLEEVEDIEITLAALLDREIPGDPIWLQNIANSGDKKTELCRSFKGYDRNYSLDTLSTNTLVSGLAKKNKKTGELEPAAGLLMKMDGMVLTIKDFTTNLGRSEEYRTELFGQLRAVYDGYYEVGYGSLPEPIRINSTIGFIGFCTPIIDRYSRLESALGTRFLKVRSQSDPYKATSRALENALNGGEMREELQNAVRGFVNYLRDSGAFDGERLPKLSKAQRVEIVKMGLYIAEMRASIWARYDSNGSVILMEAINRETPTRVSLQMMKIAVLLAIMRGHRKVEKKEMDTLRRIARDTALPTRQTIIDVFYNHAGGVGKLTTQDIDGITKTDGNRIHYKTVRNEMAKMETLGILDRNPETGYYQLSPKFAEIARVIYPSTRVKSENKPDLASFSEVTTEGGTLRDKIAEFQQVLGDIEKAIGGPVDFLKFVKELMERGWTATEVKKIKDVLKRDRLIYEPRPGFIARCI